MAVTIDGVGEINGVVLPTTGFGKVLQVVRATDTTSRSTTSATFVDASLSVTITPQKSDSAILLIYLAVVYHSVANGYAVVQITDASNNAISGAQGATSGSGSTSDFVSVTTIIGYATPATTSATTYKVRFRRADGGTTNLQNGDNTGQLFAIEVSA